MISLAYSGDVIQLQADNPDLEFAIPEEGAMLWSGQHDDARQGVEHPYAAETMMNYVYEPEVAAKIAAYVNYVTPVRGRPGGAREDRPGARREPADLPARRDAAQLQAVPGALAEEERQMNEAMAQVTGA